MKNVPKRGYHWEAIHTWMSVLGNHADIRYPLIDVDIKFWTLKPSLSTRSCSVWRWCSSSHKSTLWTITSTLKQRKYLKSLHTGPEDIDYGVVVTKIIINTFTSDQLSPVTDLNVTVEASPHSTDVSDTLRSIVKEVLRTEVRNLLSHMSRDNEFTTVLRVMCDMTELEEVEEAGVDVNDD